MPVPANIPNTLHRNKACPGFCLSCWKKGHYSVSRKGKVVPMQAMKAYGRNDGISPYISHLNTRWRSVVTIMLQSLHPPRKNPWYPMHRMEAEWPPESVDKWLRWRQSASQLHSLPCIISAICIVCLRQWVSLHNPHTCNPICTTYRNT